MTRHPPLSWPDLFRPSTSFYHFSIKTWMPARSREETRYALLRGHDEVKSSLRLEWARQQAFDRRIDRHRSAQDRRDRVRYRHIDVPRSRQFDQHRCGEFAFGQFTARRLLAAPERDAEREIARLGTGAGQDQIAQARKSRHGFAARAAGTPQPR